MLKSRLYTAGLLTALIAGGFFLATDWPADRDKGKSARSGPATNSVAGRDNQQPTIAKRPDVPDGSGSQNGGNAEESLPPDMEVRRARYICDRTSTSLAVCQSSLVGAATEQEADWLIRNGFPTPEQLQSVDSGRANLAALKYKAANGSVIAKGLLGRAYVNDGKPKEAFSILSWAAAEGSVFAVHELARVYALKDFPDHNIHESAAYVRAAYLLGDVQAARRMYLAYPAFGSTEFALADERGYEIYLGLLKLRARNGIPGSVIRPE